MTRQPVVGGLVVWGCEPLLVEDKSEATPNVQIPGPLRAVAVLYFKSWILNSQMHQLKRLPQAGFGGFLKVSRVRLKATRVRNPPIEVS